MVACVEQRVAVAASKGCSLQPATLTSFRRWRDAFTVLPTSCQTGQACRYMCVCVCVCVGGVGGVGGGVREKHKGEGRHHVSAPTVSVVASSSLVIKYSGVVGTTCDSEAH